MEAINPFIQSAATLRGHNPIETTEDTERRYYVKRYLCALCVLYGFSSTPTGGYPWRPLTGPPATYGGQFLHTDIFEMAAAYLFHLVKNHPFIDGNKRVGAVATIIFLYLNGFDFDAL